jgi:hypothetical protein
MCVYVARIRDKGIDLAVKKGVQSGTSSRFARLPATCSRDYHTGNSNLKGGILYGGRPLVSNSRAKNTLPGTSLYSK